MPAKLQESERERDTAWLARARQLRCNVAEGAGRRSRADKARVYAIARGECGECVASIELAGTTGGCKPADVARVTELGSRLSSMFYRLS